MRQPATTSLSLLLALAFSLAMLPTATAVQPERSLVLPDTALQAGPMQPVVVEITSLSSPAPVARLIQGTRSVNPVFDRAVNLVLDGFAAELPDISCYAITDVRQQGGFSFVSVIGLDNLPPDLGWTLDNGVWFGLLLLQDVGAGRWQGALQGTPAFTALLAGIPEDVMSPQARKGLDPLQRADTPPSYLFPWAVGASMQYVSGIHQNGFSDKAPGWLAVDFISDGDTSAGHASSQVLAAADGTIDFICNPYYGQAAAIKVGDLMYTHLLNGSNLYQGRMLKQGEVIGELKSGSFSEVCGVARQAHNQFHLHLGFLKTAGLQIEGWTLNLADHQWYRDGVVRNVHSWFIAGEGAAAQTNLDDTLGEVAGGGREPWGWAGWAGIPLLSPHADELWIGGGCLARLR